MEEFLMTSVKNGNGEMLKQKNNYKAVRTVQNLYILSKVDK